MRTIAVTRRALAMIAGAMAFTVAAVSSAAAQSNSDQVGASATVNRPVNVSKVSDLEFGNVFPGVTTTVAVTDAGTKQAGQVAVTGHSSSSVSIKITAPDKLQGTGTATGESFPIAFTGYLTQQATATGGATLANDIDAGNSVTNSATLSAATPGVLNLFIGGTITPPAQQMQGTYTATIDVEVVYP